MYNDRLKISGYAEFERIDKKTKKILSKGFSNNLVVNNGLEQVAKLLNGVSSNYFQKIAIGTDGTQPQNTDSTLGNQVDIKTATMDYEASYKSYWEETFTFGSGTTIREAGIFVSDGGIMLDRVTFNDQNVGIDVDFHIKITITIERA